MNVTFMWKSTIPTMTRMLNSYYSFPCTDVDSTVQSCTIYLPSIELDISALSNISSFYFLISFALSNCLAPPSDDDTLLLSVKFRYYSYYFLFRLILFRMTLIFPFRNGGQPVRHQKSLKKSRQRTRGYCNCKKSASSKTICR